MTPERWQQVDDIFQAAMELRAEDRPAFVDSASSGDQELRHEVESLITADEQGLSLVEEPAFQVAASLLASSAPQLAEGQSISHYEILGPIGRGGMGEVYLANDKLLNRRVALKLLPADYSKHNDRLRRFQQEAQAASALNHPNILTIYELGQVDGQQFIATELVDGQTLRQRMKRGKLIPAEALDIAIQAAGALAAAHRAGIVHRDIKPENIMMRPDGYVKVLDFGLAKLTQQESNPCLTDAENPETSSGLLMGTVKYMSPEQARGLSVDLRTDIFSLGVVLYEMLTGHAPFNGDGTSNIVKSILKDEPRPLAGYAPDLPEELQRIVSKALQKNRTKRYEVADELLVDLKIFRQQVEVTARSEPASRRSDGAVSTPDHEAHTASTLKYFASQMREHQVLAAVSLISLAFLLAGYPLAMRISKRATLSQLKVTMLTTTGNVVDAAISPDGKYVAYRNADFRTAEPGLQRLTIRDLTTNEERQIIPSGDPVGLFPVFSPDGKYLYYESVADPMSGWNGPSAFSLHRRAVSGGPAETIVDRVPRKIAISPDGRQIAFIRQDSTQGASTLVLAKLDGTEERSVITRKAPDYFQSALRGGPSWAPDGKSIVYVAVDRSDGYQRIFEVNLETRLERPLTSQKWDYAISDIAWLPDSSGILFNASNSKSSSAIWRLSYPDGYLQRITNDTNRYDTLSVTNDSNSLATIQMNEYVDLWVAPNTDSSGAHRVMAGRHDGFYGFTWAPDGKIVYTRETSGNSDIWIANRDGTKQKQLTIDAHQNVWPAVTSEGRYIVFQSNRTGSDHIWRMDIDGGNQKQLTFGTGESFPSCSTDWVVYKTVESGKDTVWKISLEGGTAQQIIDVRCNVPVVSHNGKLIACSALNRMLIFSFNGGQPVATTDVSWGPAPLVGWTPDDQAVTYGKFSGGVANYWIQPIDGGPPKQLTFFKPDQLASSHGLSLPAWSPDGKDLLYTRYEKISDMVLVSGLK
jgi:serine/threonine protein kinase